jgi:hypothetical protein
MYEAGKGVLWLHEAATVLPSRQAAERSTLKYAWSPASKCADHDAFAFPDHRFLDALTEFAAVTPT